MERSADKRSIAECDDLAFPSGEPGQYEAGCRIRERDILGKRYRVVETGDLDPVGYGEAVRGVRKLEAEPDRSAPVVGMAAGPCVSGGYDIGRRPLTDVPTNVTLDYVSILIHVGLIRIRRWNQ